jgi:competence protein ComGC
MHPTPRSKAFTMLELLLIVLPTSILIVALIFCAISFFTWAQNTTDHHNYTILNAGGGPETV